MKKALALSALPLAFLFVAAVQSPTSTQLAAIQLQLTRLETKVDALAANHLAANPEGTRKFYLTRTTHNGAQALSACAGGYHMASLLEILDPSNLRYDTELGRTQGDSGFGPPIGVIGWVRSGRISDRTNCDAWTNGSFGVGPLIFLADISDPTAAGHSPWVPAQLESCNTPLGVWCVED